MDQERERIRRLMISINRVDGLYYMMARRSGVQENTLALLYALDDGRPHSQKQICEEWVIPKTTINTIVKECMAAGYVSPAQADGMAAAHGEKSKEKMLLLTPQGKEYARRVLRPLYRIEDAALERTLAESGDAFISVMERFAACMKEDADKEASYAEGT